MTGLILFAHGARDPRWAEPFEAIVARVRASRPGAMVRLAFLEFIAPELPAAAADLVAAGCRRVEVLPLFLGTGGHVRRDLPQMLEQLRARHAGVAFNLHAPVGETAVVIEAIATVAGQALE